MRTRRAARVVLLDPDGRVLLVRGHDADDPGRHWWFTVGGGIDPGESVREAAVREVLEETGLQLEVDDLVGPVVTRSAIFDFARESCLQHEELFLAHVSGDATLSRARWTALEASFLDAVEWLSVDELRAVTDEVFPAELPEIVESLRAGWDGTVRHLGVQDEQASVG
ncbi:NUDIX domain-containing protein [Sanguibacter sp. YZGR15]|uniref:NUDIX domain-containing protein n=2 Tax=Sanguibacter suaedae TaxID=2795737 RepID=A0A934IAT0_9MICO|nr:NUDIX domain-containing protein [Sanguibacter suaedae]